MENLPIGKNEVFKTIDSRCRYWLLTPADGIGAKRDSTPKYVEGVIRSKLGDPNILIWDPINIFDIERYSQKEITKENFLYLMCSQGIVRFTPDELLLDYLNIHAETKTLITPFINGTYLNVDIPVLSQNRGGIVLLSMCNDPEFYERWEICS